ncbi:MAG: hypothetical protein P8Y24_13880 [Gammaproteobacteria bacterium]
MNNKALILETIFILLPASIFSFWGGAVLLFILINDKLNSGTILIALVFIAIIISSLLGLIALWIEIIARLFYKRTLLHKRLISIPMHISATIAVLSIFSLISLLIVPESKDSTGALGLFAYGAPVLFPYFYVVRTRQALTLQSS